jgi:hypothetical protein
MNKFSLQKDKKKKKVQNNFLPLEGFSIKPKLKKHALLIDVTKITLIEEQVKNEMIQKQFDRMFRKLVAMVIDVSESSSSTASDCIIALNEVTKTADMLERKYKKDLQKKELEKLKKKCWLLDNTLKKKLLEIQTNMMLKQMTLQDNYQEEKGRGR